MTFHKGAYLVLFMAVLLWAAPVSLLAQSHEEKLSLDFKNIELPALIQTISELTGKNFVYDESVKGNVTISSPVELTRGEAYNLFLTVLNVKGFTVVPSGKINKIILTRDAKESTLPSAGSRVSGEQFTTRLIPLQNADATLLASTVLPPLVPKTSYIAAFAPANTLLITDTAANIERLIGIIRELDVASAPEQLEIIVLQHAAADEVAKVCTQVLSVGAASSPRARGRNAQPAGTELSKVIPYPHTNTLVVMASSEDMDTIRTLIQKLDQKPSQQRSHINVYYLENADALLLAQTLNDILNKTQTSPTAAVPGQARATEASTSGPVSIIADKPTNSLIINATPADFDIIQGIIGQLDIKRKQVYVEALIMEISMDATKKLGMSLQGAVNIGSNSATYFSTGTSAATPLLLDDNGLPSVLSAAVDGIMMGGLFNPITVTNPLDKNETITVPALSALIDLSKTDSDVNILSAPRLLTSDNEEAEIIVGSNVPMITNRLTDSGGAGLAQSVSVERKDVALTLRFTPQITEGEQVRLQVYQEITDLVDSKSSQSVGSVDQVGPTLTKRLLRNSVIAENGKTVVLGGLIRNNLKESVSKVPLLGDIPLLGWLFKKTSRSEEKTNLLVFITPKIIRNADDLEKVTSEASMKMDLSRVGDVASDTVVENLKPAPVAEAGN
ncbi:type II secretion system secretin GspD [Trichloromonas sp.]|uniref:type II secretion system secretin GspD n=1 Tax=Trichloromonas sp. TaxID=3069249 RepID=UPI003D8135BA